MSEALKVEDVLLHEFEVLHGVKPQGSWLCDYHSAVHGLSGTGQTALCLSGGGIRSAAFAFGVIQALARKSALDHFHYLSTVSGGGYIGSWLTAGLHRRGKKTMIEDLGPWQPSLGREPNPIRWLRRYHSFLTPKLGITSGDTWTAIALVGRNLFLNWLVFLPLIVSVLLACHIYLAVMDAGGANSHFKAFVGGHDVFFRSDAYQRYTDQAPSALGLLWDTVVGLVWNVSDAHTNFSAIFNWRSLLDFFGALFVLFAITVSAANRPSDSRSTITPGQYNTFVLVPGLLGAFLLALACGHYLHYPLESLQNMIRWCCIAALILTTARALSFGYFAVRPSIHDQRSFAKIGLELFAWLISGAMTGVAIWLGLILVQRIFDPNSDPIHAQENGRRAIAVFGPTWIILSFVMGEAIYVGIACRFREGDRDREWLGRAAGVFTAAGLAWALFSGLVLYGYEIFDSVRTGLYSVIAGSGFLTLLGGASSITAATSKAAAKERLPFTQIVAALAAIFLLCLIVLLAAASRQIIDAVVPWVEETWPSLVTAPREHWAATFWVALIGCLLLGGFAQLVSLFVDVNWFSLHALYRNRLIKAFLGASNDSDDRNNFDGFSDSDNIKFGSLRNRFQQQQDDPYSRLCCEDPMSRLCAAPFTRLYPVINVALNLVSGKELAWRDRKAESFIFTPFHAGNPSVNYRDSAQYSGDVSLGTAMAISGAAVSPNWGYHSSPVTSIVMMLANLRLGWWLGNPLNEKSWKKSGPGTSFTHLMRETFGRTDNKQDFVYLSDGGHFENLGLYEMIRRRCRFIVVSDAGQDEKCTLEDLGAAVRKIKIDMGVIINFDKLQLAKQAEPPLPGFFCALGVIEYPEQHPQLGANFKADPGLLLYIKPGLHGNLPADIRAYAASNARFPHDSTLNQWFTESQFESYRALGSFIIDEITKSTTTPRSTLLPSQKQHIPGQIADLFYGARDYLAAPDTDHHADCCCRCCGGKASAIAAAPSPTAKDAT
ncbi:patatin-like phospholipase family protein [Dongia sedimenti]|uniref:Patatin-like phospholipase family protein n=1 Tax=Dongia sedimenti TaxID=3064282 RepID=A0ABU0YI66_9PROT|nr:patatin-like phospholipase family protein [Rhodospirillaceae bacterium R-7]